MLKKTLDQLEKDGIVAEVTKPTDWVHNLVVTEKKNGGMRLCLNPRPLNQAIRREHHRIPTPTDVQTRLAGKRVFSVMDAFWHVKLTEILFVNLQHAVGQKTLHENALWTVIRE